MKPIPEQAPAPWATTATATAPLSGNPVSGIHAQMTGPIPAGLRRPVLPFQQVQPEPLEEGVVPPRHAIVPLETLEQELKPESRTTRRDWPLAVAVASVVTMLLVTGVQVAVELRSSAVAAVSVSMLPLPAAKLVAPMLSNAPLSEVPSAASALPSVSSVASSVPVPLRAPVVRPRQQPRGDLVDPWGK